MQGAVVPWTRDSDWTPDHLKLLYLISRYSHCARSAAEKERWIRKIPLLVLLYEGTVAKVFDYDYAPASEVIGTRRVYLNISQEGRDDIDDLREGGLVNGLKLSSKEYQSVTAYQISPDGLAMLAEVTESQRAVVDALIECGEGLLEVRWDGDLFHLRGPGKDIVSTITECEDVSYVSSPWLPGCLRTGPALPTDNSGRAEEAAAGVSNIRDELEEVISLAHVHLMVGEWIPFGANQIVALNDKLGASERVSGGLFTALVDEEPTGTQFEVASGLTSVSILDFDLTRHINFEAEVYYPEDPGIVQVEHFGVHMREAGNTIYGLRVEAILQHGADHVSLDHLSRLLADIHQDSSQIVDSLISSYQRSLLEMTFLGDSRNRDKFNVLLAEGITPRLPAAGYMDKEAHENELKQVLGDTQNAWDLGEADELLLVLGRHGLLLAGPRCRDYEATLCGYLALMGLDIFIRNFFNRTFVLGDTLKSVRHLIQVYERDPNSIPRIRRILSEASKDVILLDETLSYLAESLDLFEEPAPRDAIDEQLHALLSIGRGREDLRRRVRDLRKNVHGARHELDGLREMTDVISETQMFRLQEAMRANSKNLESVFRSNERASSSLEILQIVLSGTLAFEILDRLTGEWSVTDTEWAKSFIVEPLMRRPLVWFLINLGTWACIAFALMALMRWLTRRSTGVLTYRFTANLPVELEALRRFLATKLLEEEDVDADQRTRVHKVAWQETDDALWGGSAPRVELLYDERHAFLLKVYLQVDKNRKHLSRDALKARFLEHLRAAGVLEEEAE